MKSWRGLNPFRWVFAFLMIFPIQMKSNIEWVILNAFCIGQINIEPLNFLYTLNKNILSMELCNTSNRSTRSDILWKLDKVFELKDETKVWTQLLHYVMIKLLVYMFLNFKFYNDM